MDQNRGRDLCASAHSGFSTLFSAVIRNEPRITLYLPQSAEQALYQWQQLADSGMDSCGAVGHQQQAVGKDIPGVGFPNDVEQEAAQHGNESHINVKIAAYTGFFAISPTDNTKQQAPQIQHILPCVPPLNIGPA